MGSEFYPLQKILLKNDAQLPVSASSSVLFLLLFFWNDPSKSCPGCDQKDWACFSSPEEENHAGPLINHVIFNCCGYHREGESFIPNLLTKGYKQAGFKVSLQRWHYLRGQAWDFPIIVNHWLCRTDRWRQDRKGTQLSWGREGRDLLSTNRSSIPSRLSPSVFLDSGFFGRESLSQPLVAPWRSELKQSPVFGSWRQRGAFMKGSCAP